MNKKIFRNLWPFLQPHLKWIILSLALTVIVAGIAQVNPFVIQFLIDQVDSYLATNVSSQEVLNLFFTFTILLLAKELLNAGVQFSLKFIGERLKAEVASDLSTHATRHVLSLSPSFFADRNNSTGRLVKRIDLGAEGLSKTVKNAVVDFLPLLASSAVALVIMYRANFWVGLTSTLIIPVFFLLSFKQAELQKGVRRDIQSNKENRTNRMVNLFDAILVIKSFVREKYEEHRFRKLNKSIQSQEIAHHKTNHFFDSTKIFSEQVGVVAIILLTAYLVIIGQMSIGAIMFHLLLYNNITSPIRHLHRIYDEYNEAVTYGEGFFELLDTNSTISNSGHKNHCDQWAFELEDIYFEYPNGNIALNGVSLRFRPGETTALVGLSGAGKTTIVNLLMRFFDPSAGKLLLHGIPISEYPLDFIRQNIGLVLQKNHIFEGSIADNIRYGNLDASNDDVALAAKMAYLHEEVIDLPNGYEADASNLSIGQQQRIALARVFLKDPPVVFLDEPTASLDAIATEQIKNALDAIKANRTVVVVSHNISQIINADHIYVVETGRIIDEGSHESLIRNGGLYFQIIDSFKRTINLDRLTNPDQETAV